MTQIEVKCKKCRYRFMVDVNPGETEISCVCPRCGLPFTHLVGAADKIVGATPPPVPATGTSSQTPVRQRPAGGIVPPREPSPRMAEGHAVATPPPPPPPIAPTDADRRQSDYGVSSSSIRPPRRGGSARRGCAWGCLFLMLVVALLIFLVRRGGWRDSQSQLPQVETVDTAEEEKLSAEAHEAGKSKERSEGKGDEPPTWLEDFWYGKAKYGEIKILFRKGNINFQAGAKRRRGTYTIHGDLIRCQFNTGKATDYRLDRKNHRVITGDNITLAPNVGGPDVGAGK